MIGQQTPGKLWGQLAIGLNLGVAESHPDALQVIECYWKMDAEAFSRSLQGQIHANVENIDTS